MALAATSAAASAGGRACVSGASCRRVALSPALCALRQQRGWRTPPSTCGPSAAVRHLRASKKGDSGGGDGGGDDDAAPSTAINQLAATIKYAPPPPPGSLSAVAPAAGDLPQRCGSLASLPPSDAPPPTDAPPPPLLPPRAQRRRKQKQIEAMLAELGPETVEERLQSAVATPASPPYRLTRLIAELVPTGRAVLAFEVCRASPSTTPAELAALAKTYEAAGADVIVVPTDSYDTPEGLKDLFAVCQAVRVPVMRRDWMIHPLQARGARARRSLCPARCRRRRAAFSAAPTAAPLPHFPGAHIGRRLTPPPPP